MKAVTLTQPWATLVAIGAKRIETRSWRTLHRGPLAIHAALGLGGLHRPGDSWDPQWKLRQRLMDIIESEPFKSTLAPHLSGYTPEERAADLPRGRIIAVVSVKDCVPADNVDFASGRLADREGAFGDFSHGRWAWLFERPVHIYDGGGIECKGGRGLWTVPEEVRREIAELDDRGAAISL